MTRPPPLPGSATAWPLDFCKHHRIVPLPGDEAETLRAAVPETLPAQVLDNLAALLRRPVRAERTPEGRLRELMDAYLFAHMDETQARASDSGPGDELAHIDLSRQEPAVQAVNTLLYEGVQRGASDIHIHPPSEPGRPVRVRYRVDGCLVEAREYPAAMMDSIVCRLKVMSGLDIAQSRVPQDGSMRVGLGGRTVDVRLSTVPCAGGEDVSLRLLDRGSLLLSVEDLGLEAEELGRVRALLAGTRGMIIVTGPTGSGKTTSLYAFVQRLLDGNRNIVTIEDPIEYRIPGITQIEVKPDIQLTFAAGLRAILRHDPDILMVGEIRDAETARIAVQAALTGHLVLTTLHTADTAGAATRLFDLGVEPYLVRAALSGLVAQRLVRRLCPRCRGTEPRDCPECYGTGFRGRTGIYEVAMVDEPLRDLLGLRATPDQIREHFRKTGVRLLQENALKKADAGLTTRAEAASSVA